MSKHQTTAITETKLYEQEINTQLERRLEVFSLNDEDALGKRKNKFIAKQMLRGAM